MKLIYVMDPMCSWCYAFSLELEEFLTKHSNLEIDYIMGGLAPDSDIPMADEMRKAIASYWVEIEKKTQVTFNHDFWKLNTPYRSSFPACRAVLSSETLEKNSSSNMIKAIQNAYYKEAKNPSLKETLVECAKSISLDENDFIRVFKSVEIEDLLQHHFNITTQLQVRGFPALFYINDLKQAVSLTTGFTTASNLESEFIKKSSKFSISK